MNELIEKQDKLYNKMIGVLNKDDVVANDTTISLMDIKNAIINEICPYNELLIEKSENLIKKLNKSSVYSKSIFSINDLPKVNRIINTISKNNNMYVKIVFGSDLIHTGGYILLGKKDGKIKVINTILDEKSAKNFLESNYDLIDFNFRTMNSFSNRYPNINYDFDSEKRINNENEEYIGDGFISTRINLNDPKSMMATFNNITDTVLSTIHTKKYGEMFDYIELYNDSFLSKTSVKIDSLNPFTRKVYDNYIETKNIDKGNSLTLSK